MRSHNDGDYEKISICYIYNESSEKFFQYNIVQLLFFVYFIKLNSSGSPGRSSNFKETRVALWYLHKRII